MKKTFFSLPCWGRWHGRAVTDEVPSSNKKAKTDLIHQNRSCSGFTIVELVVTLTLIVIVSVISIGVVAVNNKTYGETIDMIEATNIAENAVECFRFVKNNHINIEDEENGFKPLMKKAGIILVDAETNDEIDYAYTANVDDVVVKIEIKGNTITVSARSDTDENLLEAKSYTVR